jgi:hypothetical protein
MQPQNNTPSLHYVSPIDITPLKEFITSESERQRQEFIGQQPSHTRFGCLSPLSLEHLLPVSINQVRPEAVETVETMEMETTQYGEPMLPVIGSEQVLTIAAAPHCGCIGEETLSNMEAPSVNNYFDNEEWIEEQLLNNQAL